MEAKRTKAGIEIKCSLQEAVRLNSEIDVIVEGMTAFTGSVKEISKVLKPVLAPRTVSEILADLEQSSSAGERDFKYRIGAIDLSQQIRALVAKMLLLKYTPEEISSVMAFIATQSAVNNFHDLIAQAKQ